MAHITKKIAINSKENPIAATEQFTSGVTLLGSIKQTLGPYGKNFATEKGTRITNDGRKIASELQGENEKADLALRIARNAMIKTNDELEDGSTSFATMLEAGYLEFTKLLSGKTTAKQYSILSLRKKIAEELSVIKEKMKDLIIEIKSEEELVGVAKTSVEDQAQAELIAKTQWELGPDGYILVEEHNKAEDEMERINGIRIDNGFSTSNAINNKEKQRLELSNIPILLTNYTFDDIYIIRDLLDTIHNKQHVKEIAIMARAFSSQAIKQMEEEMRNGFRIMPLNAPYVNQKEVMKDLAAIFGATFIDSEQTDLDSVVSSHVGFAKRIIAERWSATYSGEKDEKAEKRIADRVKELEETLVGTTSLFEQKNIKVRLSQLKNGFALLKIGALTEDDRKYRFDKAEDCVGAVRHALQEGVVPGAGLVYKLVADNLPEDFIMKKPLLAPYTQIMLNAGEPFEVEPWVKNAFKVERVILENATQTALNMATVYGISANEWPRKKFTKEDFDEE